MTRAEEAAKKAYPRGVYNGDVRRAFRQGYRQAEQDLALTWEDMQIINQMISAVDIDFSDDQYCTVPDQKFYEEVLKRFNEWKREHSDKN